MREDVYACFIYCKTFLSETHKILLHLVQDKGLDNNKNSLENLYWNKELSIRLCETTELVSIEMDMSFRQ